MPSAMNRSNGNSGGNGNQEHRISRPPPPNKPPSSNESSRGRKKGGGGGGGGRCGGSNHHNALTRREADASWSRVLSRRVRQLRTLDVRQLGEIEGLLGRDPHFPPPPPPGDTTETHVGYLRGVLERHFQIALDAKLRNDLRSRSLDTVKRLLTAIDEQYAEGGPRPPQQKQRRTQQRQQREEQRQRQQQQGQQRKQQEHGGSDRVADESDRSRPHRRQEQQRQQQRRVGTSSGGAARETSDRSEAGTTSLPSSSTRGEVAVSAAKPPPPSSSSSGGFGTSVAGGSGSRAPGAVVDTSNGGGRGGAAELPPRKRPAPAAAITSTVAKPDSRRDRENCQHRERRKTGGEKAVSADAPTLTGTAAGGGSVSAEGFLDSRQDSATAVGGRTSTAPPPQQPQDHRPAVGGGAVVAAGSEGTTTTASTSNRRTSSSPPARSAAGSPPEAVADRNPGGGEGRRNNDPPSFVAALFATSDAASQVAATGDGDRAGASGGVGGGSASATTTPAHTRAGGAAKKVSDGRGGEGGGAASTIPSPVQAGKGPKSGGGGGRDGGGGGAAAAARTRVIAAKKMGSTSSRVASASDGKKRASASSSPKPKPPPAEAEKTKSTVARKLAQLTSTRRMGTSGKRGPDEKDGASAATADAVTSGAVAAPRPKPGPAPPPPPKPPKVVTADFHAESPKTSYSAALTPRVPCRIFYSPAPSTAVPDRDMRKSFEERLDRWDPYWRRVHDVADFHLDTTAKTDGGAGRDKVVEVRDSGYFVTTSPVIRTEPELYSSSPGENQPRTCLSVTFELPKEVAAERGSDGKAVSWGFAGKTGQQPEDGERRLLVRMLPVTPLGAGAGRRADTHLWPKGTFLQVNGRPVRIKQRRQQSHDPKLWKGMCEPLDLTPLVSDPMGRNTLSLLTREDAPYGVQISVVEYRGPRTLLAEAVASKEVISYDVSVELARRYVGAQTVVLDDSDDDDGDGDGAADGGSSSLTWQLTCPMAMRTMEVPARGRNCRHMQCFDLFTFLHANSFPSGRRWMCPACDGFVSLEDAVLCGLFREMIRRHKDEVDDGADRVNFCADGTWKLAPVKKRGATGDGAVIPGTKRKKAPEVILL